MNSKSKGNAFERQVAKELSLWYYNDPNVLMRSPSSGAVFNKRKDSDLNVAGDIYQVKHDGFEEWPFVVECKHHKSFPLDHMIRGVKTSKPYVAWEKCKVEARENDKHPILIVKENSKPVYCVVSLAVLRGVLKKEDTRPLILLENEVAIIFYKDLINGILR